MAERVKPKKKPAAGKDTAKKAAKKKATKKPAAKKAAKKSGKKASKKAPAEKGYKGHRKGSVAEKLRRIYDEEGVESARKAAKRMETRGEIASHTYRSLFSFWSRDITPGSGKRRGRKVPVRRDVAPPKEKATTAPKRRVKPKTDAAPPKRRVQPKKAA